MACGRSCSSKATAIAPRWKSWRGGPGATSKPRAWRSSPSVVRRTSPGSSRCTVRSGHDLVVAGLCDVGEARSFQRGLARAGFGDDLTREQMEASRLLRVRSRSRGRVDPRPRRRSAVEHVIEQQGELASLRIMQRQPAQRGRTAEEQLRRFIGTRSRRKIRYGQLLVEALRPRRRPATARRRARLGWLSIALLIALLDMFGGRRWHACCRHV